MHMSRHAPFIFDERQQRFYINKPGLLTGQVGSGVAGARWSTCILILHLGRKVSTELSRHYALNAFMPALNPCRLICAASRRIARQSASPQSYHEGAA